MAISVEVSGAKELIAELRDLPEAFQKPVINKLSAVAYDSALKGAGRHVVTGALFQSLDNRPITGGREVGHDPNRAPQALWVNFGTKRHWIGPKDKKALRWVPPSLVGPTNPNLKGKGGGFAFSKGHWHPGYRGDPYMVQAKDDALAQFSTIVDKTLKEAL